MNVLLIIHTYSGTCKMQACQLAAFLHLNGIAKEHIAVIGYGPAETDEELMESLRIISAERRAVVLSDSCVPEEFVSWLAANVPRPELCLLPGDRLGQETAVRLGVRWKGSSLTQVTSVRLSSGTAVRSFYAGHLEGTFKLSGLPYVISVDPSIPAVIPVNGCDTGKQQPDIQHYMLSPDSETAPVIRKQTGETSGLQRAARVVICGMGTGNIKNAKEAAELAGAVSMEVGATRPAVMNAWFPSDRLVGVSGSMIAPEICILLGVSGAPAFYSGIRHAGMIIAINQDRNAPIMKKADLAIVGDCMEVFRNYVRMVQEGR